MLDPGADRTRVTADPIRTIATRHEQRQIQMCGIAGKVSARGAIDRTVVESMCAAQQHRGPDSRGIHEADGVCLGIQRLRVIDLETGDQPIYNEDRDVAVVLNGEIYNFRELRDELRQRGHTFSTDGDTEVIVHLYEEHGADLVDRLDGMFTFALWDEKRRKLLIARDRVGKKPLYYYEGKDTLAFASELRALVSDPSVPRRLDPSALDSYLAYGYVPAPWSIWEQVRKLEPGHLLEWSEGGATTRRYWSLDYSDKLEGDPRELSEELRRQIGAAVERRMIADVPLGAFLSGGIDSSIVVAEMAALSPEPIKTFSIGFAEPEYDERSKARAVAEMFSTDHHEQVIDPDAIALLPDLAARYGEPYADSSAIPSFLLAEFARRDVTVALNGDGGDESFAGYLRYTANAAVAGIEHVPAGVRGAIARAGRAMSGGTARRGKRAYAQRLLATIDEPLSSRYESHVSIFGTEARRRILRAEIGAEILPARTPELISRRWESASGSTTIDRLLEVDVETYLPGDLLTKVDIATMAHSLEARSPLLDHHLMEFAAALPSELKARGTSRKRLLRQAYDGLLPETTMHGPKMGFAVPLDHWFRGELRSYVEETLLDPGSLSAQYIEPAEVERLAREHANGEAEHSGRLWSLLSLEWWQRSVAQREGEGVESAAAGSRA